MKPFGMANGRKSAEFIYAISVGCGQQRGRRDKQLPQNSGGRRIAPSPDSQIYFGIHNGRVSKRSRSQLTFLPQVF
jgi:hypothetical protein